MSRDPMQTIIARAKAIVRAVSISGSDDIDDWLLAAVYGVIFATALVMLLLPGLFV